MTRSRISKRRALICASCVAAVLAGLGAAGTANAQAAEEADEAGLQDIVVTAQKRAENVQDVPLAVSVTTGDDIERLQISNIESLQYSSPSLVVAGGDPARKRFGICGISDQSRNAGFENRIGVYVDGV